MSRDRRGDRTQEVIGSIPFSSTKIRRSSTPHVQRRRFCLCGRLPARGIMQLSSSMTS